MDRKWIWEHPDYPKFKYDRSGIEHKLEDIYKKKEELEKLRYELDDISFFKLFLDSLSSEIYNSWKIEGEILDRESIRSSILKSIVSGIPGSSKIKKYEKISEVVADSKRNKADLTLERVLNWHKIIFDSDSHNSIFKITPGAVRKNTMCVVSGPIGREKIHFRAPEPEQLKKELDVFFEYIKKSAECPIVKVGIIHLWFLIIHPLDDGNGRITRLMVDHILSQTGGYAPSFSRAIELDRKSYYNALEKTNKISPDRPLDITDWMIWHLETINTAYELAINELSSALEKGKIRQIFNDLSIKELKFVDLIIDGSILDPNVKKYRKVNHVSEEEALYSISRMEQIGVFKYLGIEISAKARNILEASKDFTDNSPTEMSKLDR